MFCRNCGAEIPDGSAFCPKCGAALWDDASGNHMPQYSLANERPDPLFRVLSALLPPFGIAYGLYCISKGRTRAGKRYCVDAFFLPLLAFSVWLIILAWRIAMVGIYNAVANFANDMMQGWPTG